MITPAVIRRRLRATVLGLAALACALAVGAPALADGATGGITGTIVDSGGVAVPDVCVSALPSAADRGDAGYGFAISAADGSFALPALPVGAYDLQFQACGSTTNVIGGSLPGVAVRDGATTSIGSFALATGGVIAGRVTLADEGLQRVCVSASRTEYDASGGSWGMGATDPDGFFEIRGLGSGTFTVTFAFCGPDDAPTGAPTGFVFPTRSVDVTLGQVTAISDTSPVAGGTITGVVRGPDGSPEADVCAIAMGAPGSSGGWGFAITGEDGSYAIRSLASGDYVLYFLDCGRNPEAPGGSLASEWWDDGASHLEADTVGVTSGTVTDGIDASLSAQGAIAGRVAVNGGDGPLTPGGVCVAAFSTGQLDAGWASPVGLALTEDDGSYVIPDLLAGSYRIAMLPCARSERLQSLWYDGSPDDGGAVRLADAATVVVGADGSTTLDDVTLNPPDGSLVCNEVLYFGVNCDDPAAYESDPIPRDIPGGEYEVIAPNTDVSVIVRSGLFEETGRITIDANPPDAPGAAEPTLGEVAVEPISDHVKVTVRDGGRTTSGGDWDPPLHIVMPVPVAAADVPDDALVVYYDTEGVGDDWTQIPYIGSRGVSPVLDAGEPDGYYVTGAGADRVVHVLTRHATTFALFDATEARSRAEAPPPAVGRAPGPPAAPTVLPSGRSAQGARVPARLRLRQGAALPRTTDRGLALTWRSATRRICRVTRGTTRAGGQLRVAWRVHGLARGTCVVVGVNAGSGTVLPASITRRIVVR